MPIDEYAEWQQQKLAEGETLAKEYPWYYDSKNIDEHGDPDILSAEKSYEVLAQMIANKLKDDIYQKILDYMHNTSSNIYGDYPTMWEQYKYDVGQGDEPIWYDTAVDYCETLINQYTLPERYLLWIHLKNGDYPEYAVENADISNDIAMAILNDIYKAAEAEITEEERS